MTIEGVRPREKRAWAQELLETVGLWEHRKHRLAQLSGGQQQRVAIAVALANRPGLLLGDEPTGEVDSATAREILDLFRQMNRRHGLTTIIVTHDPQVARAVDRVVTIRDGSTSSETVRRVADVEAALASRLDHPGVEAAADHVHVYEEFVVVDGAGRLQIPPDLRAEVGIGSRVTLERSSGGILIRPVDGPQPAGNAAARAGDAVPAAGAAKDDLSSARVEVAGRALPREVPFGHAGAAGSKKTAPEACRPRGSSLVSGDGRTRTGKGLSSQQILSLLER